MTEPTASPLAEADIDSLNELFARDPLKLTDQDLNKIIGEFRKARAKWQVDEKAKVPKKEKTPKAVKGNISLDDLGI